MPELICVKYDEIVYRNDEVVVLLIDRRKIRFAWSAIILDEINETASLPQWLVKSEELEDYIVEG